MPRILEVDEREPRPMDTDRYDDDGGSAWRAAKKILIVGDALKAVVV